MRGRLILNGNQASPSKLFAEVRPYLASARQHALGARSDGAPPRVLVVSAAWGAGERNDGMVQEALVAAGISGPERVISLGAWTARFNLLRGRPQTAKLSEELEALEEQARALYVEKTRFLAERIRRGAREVRTIQPDFRLGSLPDLPRDELRPEAMLDASGLYARGLRTELIWDLVDLVAHDRRMLQLLAEAEDRLLASSGLRFDPEWRSVRAHLEGLILSADALVLPGGDPLALLGALRFFDLGPALQETLRLGATLLAVSAGTLVLGERIIVYDDFSPDPARREFRLVDRGLGLLGGLQVLPHCDDRIHTDNPDNLAYLARRFASHVCVGLNEGSLLLLDFSTAEARSIGATDGVYVFGPDGRKFRFDRGERLEGVGIRFG